MAPPRRIELHDSRSRAASKQSVPLSDRVLDHGVEARPKGRAELAQDEQHVAAPPAARGSLRALREAAVDCRACPLWRNATQTVFGNGNPQARLFVVGEQPGHSEDLSGQPFVGPAGQLFDRLLSSLGVSREDIYITNAVKHFKWELRGKRRLHKTPAQREIEACHPWLEAELNLVAPRAVLCLGATAARAVMGGPVRVGEHRGKAIRQGERDIIVTIHPAYVLRLQDAAAEAAYRALAEDIALAVRCANA